MKLHQKIRRMNRRRLVLLSSKSDINFLHFENFMSVTNELTNARKFFLDTPPPRYLITEYAPCGRNNYYSNLKITSCIQHIKSWAMMKYGIEQLEPLISTHNHNVYILNRQRLMPGETLEIIEIRPSRNHYFGTDYNNCNCK